jgi:hypothetical protein
MACSLRAPICLASASYKPTNRASFRGLMKANQFFGGHLTLAACLFLMKRTDPALYANLSANRRYRLVLTNIFRK